LIGIEPEEADPELGYIVPGAVMKDGTRLVERFVEKPELALARSLLAKGALWNSFIFAAGGPALIGLMRERMPDVVDAMATAIARDSRIGTRTAVEDLYRDLPIVDFSRAVIQGAESQRPRAAGAISVRPNASRTRCGVSSCSDSSASAPSPHAPHHPFLRLR